MAVAAAATVLRSGKAFLSHSRKVALLPFESMGAISRGSLEHQIRAVFFSKKCDFVTRGTDLVKNNVRPLATLAGKKMEAAPGFEPGMRVLQTRALPLGDAASVVDE